MNLRKRKVHLMTRDVAEALWVLTARTLNLRGNNGDAPTFDATPL
jgi:hypothetical protein